MTDFPAQYGRESDSRLRIELLSEHRDVIPRLAEWHHRQWAPLTGKTLEQRKATLERCAQGRQIPLAVAAFLDDQLAGSASLIEHDMDTHPDLTPWLASVFVAPEFRENRIGSALVRRIMEEAVALGIDTLYLYTPDRASFYARLGWRLKSRETYREQPVTVMDYRR